MDLRSFKIDVYHHVISNVAIYCRLVAECCIE